MYAGAQGPYDNATALLRAFRGGSLHYCQSPGWGRSSFNFLPFTTIPFTPPFAVRRPFEWQIFREKNSSLLSSFDLPFTLHFAVCCF